MKLLLLLHHMLKRQRSLKRNSLSNNSIISSFSSPRGGCGYLCSIECSVWNSKGSLSYTHDYGLTRHPCAWDRWCRVPCGRVGGRRLKSTLGIEASEDGDVDGKEQFKGSLENATKEWTEGPVKNKWNVKSKITLLRGIRRGNNSGNRNKGSSNFHFYLTFQIENQVLLITHQTPPSATTTTPGSTHRATTTISKCKL